VVGGALNSSKELNAIFDTKVCMLITNDHVKTNKLFIFIIFPQPIMTMTSSSSSSMFSIIEVLSFKDELMCRRG
jgi:hypothetical protein